MKKDICSFTYEELKEEMASIGKNLSGQDRSTTGFT